MKFWITSLIISCLLMGCQKKVQNSDNEEKDRLYSSSILLIEEFSNKIKNIKDSLELDSLIENFDKKITDINFKFPPMTDLKMTEEENDSIILLMNKMVELKNQKLKELDSIYKANQYLIID